MKRSWLTLIALLPAALCGLPPFPAAGQTPTNSYTFVPLGHLGGGHTRAYGLNDSGQVVGCSDTALLNSHAFLWQSGAMTDLGTLGGSNSVAYGINNSGYVVGAS